MTNLTAFLLFLAAMIVVPALLLAPIVLLGVNFIGVYLVYVLVMLAAWFWSEVKENKEDKV